MEKENPESVKRYRQTGDLSWVEGSESIEDIRKRSLKVMKDIVNRNGWERIAIFGHGNWMVFFLSNLLDRKYHELRHRNCQYVILQYDEKKGEFEVVKMFKR